jgi:zinc protease
MNRKVGHNRVVIIFSLLAGLVFLCVGCQRERPGEAAAQFDYRHIELDNGLDVITLEDFSCPIVAVQLWYHVGSKDEQADRQGFAHMFEHMMFRGTDKLGPTDHFSYIRRVGGTTNGYTGFDRTVYLETLPAEQLELALWLEVERMTFLKIDQEAFDTERKVVEEERRMRLNQPYGTVVENLLAEIFEVHPYRWSTIGKIPHLRAASAQELRDFWTRYYVPSNATLIIVGAVKHEEAQLLAKRYFGWIPRYDEPGRVTVVEPKPTSARSIKVKEENAPTPAVGVVYRTVPIKHEDTVALDILTEILGGGNSSRLYRELVAEKQLAVGAQSFMWSLEQDGIFAAGAVMPPFGSDANSVLEIIEEHIGRLRREAVSERELMKAKNQMLRGLVTTNLRIESKARMVGHAAVEYGDVSQVNRHLEDIRKVTAEDILRVANEYLGPEDVLKVKVERSLLGAADKLLEGIVGKKEEEAPITAEAEKMAPKPGRGGLVRDEDYPEEAPFVKASAAKLTPEYSSRMLENGLKVLVVPNHEVPFVSVQLGFLGGAWTEDKPGTAAMTMKMLTKGTSKHSEGELADELETYAISLSSSGGMDTGTINVGCLTEHIERAMGLLGEVVLSPTFPEEEFGKLRKQVLTSLAVSSAEPEYVADKEFRRRLYGEHPYSRTATGEVEDVNALVIEDLKGWWSRFARPDMMVLIFSGDVEENEAFELAKEALGDWKVSGALPQRELPELEEAGQTHIYVVDRPGSIQSQIRVGQLGITRHDSERYFVSRIVSGYFGWGFDSRLNKNIRVAKGLTYGVWGSYIAQRFAGEFKVSTFSKTESTAEAVRAALDEIERLKIEGPSEEELERNRSYILGSFVRNREMPQQIAGDLWLIESQGLGEDYIERLLAGIAKTERADCERLVEDTIRPGNLVVVVVGEAEKLKEELEQIAQVTIVAAEEAK